MVVKFIVVKTDGGKIIFGDRPAKDEFHGDIANNHDIRREDIAGGGLADLNEKKIYGTSTGFGRYDPVTVKRLLPDWNVED